MNMKEDYLGDGVYASFDGWQIWLRTSRENGDHVIALEPQLFHALERYAKQAWQPPEPKIGSEDSRGPLGLD